MTASRAMTRAQITDRIEQYLQDTGNAKFSTIDINEKIDEVLVEVSLAVPYVSRDIYTIESRFGSCSATSTSNLTDTNKSPFVSTDTEKIVYNTTDKTWAVIESVTSSSVVALSADIFTVGEGYEIYNKGCWNTKQLNIEDSDDFLWILGAVYPVQPIFSASPPLRHMRNVRLVNRRNILEIDVGWVDNSGVSAADKDVHVYFARQHKLNTMTDLAGTVNGALAVGAKTAILAAVTDADATIYKDTLFTLALASGIDSRLTYRVTADATISSTAATIYFTPALEAIVATSAVITFIGSTLPPELEPLVVQLACADLLMSWSISKIDEVNKGGASVSDKYYRTGEALRAKAERKLKALIDVDLRANVVYSRS